MSRPGAHQSQDVVGAVILDELEMSETELLANWGQPLLRGSD